MVKDWLGSRGVWAGEGRGSQTAVGGKEGRFICMVRSDYVSYLSSIEKSSAGRSTV